MGELVSLDRERAARRPAPRLQHERGDQSGQLPASAGPVPPKPVRPRPEAGRDPLWREVSGAVLRHERRRQGRTLADVAGRAGMSVQHLSEVERGRKEASSEMLAAAAGSLGLSLAEFARRCALTLGASGAAPAGPVLLAA